MTGLAKVQDATESLQRVAPIRVTYRSKERKFACEWLGAEKRHGDMTWPLVGLADNPSDAIRALLVRALAVRAPDCIEARGRQWLWQRRWKERPARWKRLDLCFDCQSTQQAQ